MMKYVSDDKHSRAEASGSSEEILNDVLDLIRATHTSIAKQSPVLAAAFRHQIIKAVTAPDSWVFAEIETPGDITFCRIKDLGGDAK